MAVFNFGGADDTFSNVVSSQASLTESGVNFTFTSLSATVDCFLEGTHIDTPTGPCAVQDLQAGDVISTPTGTTTVKWVGRQDMAPRFQHPDKINPVCITAGALAEGAPARDLFVTPDHALAVDGLLINAAALVNGSSVYKVAKMPLDGFSYYHVETDAHELLLAEGCAAETYLDMPNRDGFVNGDERAGAAPIVEMDRPRITSARLVPAQIKALLAGRVAEQKAPKAA